MSMHLRYFVAALAVLALAPTLRAQSFTACEGGTADAYPCNNVDLYARLAPSTFGSDEGNDIWGWTDPETGHEYALAGYTNGTAFVDVTNPDTPVYLGLLPTATQTSIWRDIKTYGNYAFIVSEASSHGMQVFDLTRLRDVQNPPEIFTADAWYTGFGHAHNLAIDTESGFAYAVGASNCSGGLVMVDIHDPLNPTDAGCFGGDDYVHDAQCVVYDGPDADYTGHEVCVAYDEDEIGFVDVTDKAHPVLISRGYYPNPGYTHQGWFTDDKRYILVDDELDEYYGITTNTRLIVMNVEDLDNPEYDFAYLGPLTNSDHNLYVLGQYVFWSNYAAGLRILDISGIDDDVITEVASFDTFPPNNNDGFDGQWSNYPFFASGNVVANDGSYGLFILKPELTPTASEPGAPGAAGYVLTTPSPNPTRDGAVLRLTVARTQAVRAEVLDVAGRRVALLHDGPVTAGAPVALRLDAASLPAGLYLVRVTGEDFVATRRLSLVH